MSIFVISIKDIVGLIALGILGIVFLIAWLRDKFNKSKYWLEFIDTELNSIEGL